MAIRDNVRVLYRDGLILGADELSDDQSYFRAALERRSLARDMFGIAWGLELSASAGTASVEPGVAYGGDGKVIVLRARENISHLLAGQTRDRAYAIFIQFEEHQEEGDSGFKYCMEALDPRVLEEHRFPDPEEIFGNSTFNRRAGARREPHADLLQPTTPAQSRVRLGIIRVDTQGQFSLQENASRIPCGVPSKGPSAEGAEYIGVVGATYTHPARWSGSIGQDETNVALEIDPESGVHVFDPLMLASDLYLEGHSSTDQAIHFLHGPQPVPFDAETGLVVEACDPIEKTTLLAGNKNRLSLQVPLAVNETATFAKQVTVSGPLTVDGDALFRNTTFQANVEIPNHKLTTNQLTVLASALVKTATIQDLIVNGSVTLPGNAQGIFTGPVTFQQVATFLSNLSVDGAATFGDEVHLADANHELTVDGHSNLNGGVDVAGGIEVTGTATMHNATECEQTLNVQGTLSAESVLRADRGLAFVLDGNVSSGLAVGFDVNGDLAPAAAGTGVVGISAGVSAGRTTIVSAGRIDARVNNTTAAPLPRGTWLMVGAAGELVPANPIAAGTLVGKTLQPLASGVTDTIPIVVALA